MPTRMTVKTHCAASSSVGRKSCSRKGVFLIRHDVLYDRFSTVAASFGGFNPFGKVALAMTKLLVHVPDVSEIATAEIAFGGRPSAPAGVVDWPVCRSCNGSMQFQGQLPLSDSNGLPSSLLLLFMCQNQPGMCDEWDADAGGNQVVTVPTTGLDLVQPPSSEEAVRPTRYGARIVVRGEEDYEAARAAWSKENDASPREVLGQLGGTPSWLQGEEVPSCSVCQKPMRFVAQLEQGPNWQTEMNFGGGGCAYVFHCACRSATPKFLWQC